MYIRQSTNCLATGGHRVSPCCHNSNKRASCLPRVRRRVGCSGFHGRGATWTQNVLDANNAIIQHVTKGNDELSKEQLDAVLDEPWLACWYEFLTAYGVNDTALHKAISGHPEILKSDVYTAGQAILFFKSWGWEDRDIRNRLVREYPWLLAKSVPRDLQPVINELQDAGCKDAQLRLLLWEYPRIFHKDYRMRVRQFANLGLYGLERKDKS